jgi:uncharacterized DUF497 family protein
MIMNIPEQLGIPEYEFRLIIGRTRIEYDETKEMINRRKHGYSLESAVHYFEQLFLPVLHPPFMTSDSFIENGEVRHMHMGIDDSANVVIFVTTMRDEETVRILSFRRAREAECKAFYEYTGYTSPSQPTRKLRG